MGVYYGWLLWYGFLLYIVFKIQNTFKQQKRILSAIDVWLTDLINNCDERIIKDDYFIANAFDSIEDYYCTLFRIWDWGYKRIVPPEMYEEIKEYIR